VTTVLGMQCVHLSPPHIKPWCIVDRSCTPLPLTRGADYAHPDLGACPYPGAPEPCRVAFARDFTPADDGLTDSSGHGTNVASIIAKVAPGVKILVLVGVR
jgi:hypothetical protein